MAISRLYLLRMINVWTKVVEKIKTHLLFSITFFSEKHPIYEVIWKNKVEPDRSRMTIIIQRMHFACWLTKATYTHSEYVILFFFFHFNNRYTKVPQCCYYFDFPVLDLLLLCSEYTICCELVSCLKSNNLTDLCYLKFEDKFLEYEFLFLFTNLPFIDHRYILVWSCVVITRIWFFSI